MVVVPAPKSASAAALTWAVPRTFVETASADRPSAATFNVTIVGSELVHTGTPSTTAALPAASWNDTVKLTFCVSVIIIIMFGCSLLFTQKINQKQLILFRNSIFI